MSEVKHYFWVQDGMSEGLKSQDTYVKSPDFDRVTAERDAALAQESTLARDAANWKRKACESADRGHELQQRLTAADERADVLETALRKIKARFDAYAEADMRMPKPSVEVCQMIADAALKPAEGGGDA